MNEFSSKDISGAICKFQYEINDEFPPEVKFFVYELVRNDNRYYQATFKIIDNNIAQSIEMHANYEEFKKKGIPERIIEIASCYLRRTIISSPTNPSPGNFLISDSFKVWERLVSKNPNASFVEEQGFFILKSELP